MAESVDFSLFPLFIIPNNFIERSGHACVCAGHQEKRGVCVYVHTFYFILHASWNLVWNLPLLVHSQVLRSLLGLCLFLFIMRSVSLLRRLRIFGRTTRALSRSTKEMAFVALLFFLLLAIFVQVGHLLFPSTEAFSSFGASLGSLGGALMGSYGLADIG